MVVFTCNHCGESLQKPRVEKHYSFQCKRAKSLTCVDCFKDFKNEEYTVHTKCITEEERYGAKGSIPGGVVKKGEVKQETWTEMIRSIVQNGQNLKPSLRNLFNIISNYTNVPRKKNKFVNFLKSSMGGRLNPADIDESWNLIEMYKSDQKANSGTQQNGGASAEKESQKTKRKSKENDSGEPTEKKKKTQENTPENGIEDTVFSYKETILTILRDKKSISCKKLQKKFLNEYLKQTGNEHTEKTLKKYNKKLKKLPNVRIEDDVVTLVENEQ